MMRLWRKRAREGIRGNLPPLLKQDDSRLTVSPGFEGANTCALPFKEKDTVLVEGPADGTIQADGFTDHCSFKHGAEKLAWMISPRYRAALPGLRQGEPFFIHTAWMRKDYPENVWNSCRKICSQALR